MREKKEREEERKRKREKERERMSNNEINSFMEFHMTMREVGETKIK